MLQIDLISDITLPTSESGPPPRPGPPPPRPGPPPGRPAQPPSRPAAPPSRPKQPPSRPEVPPSPKRPIVPEQQPQSKQPKQPQPESPKRGSDSSETEDEPETPLHAPSPGTSTFLETSQYSQMKRFTCWNYITNLQFSILKYHGQIQIYVANGNRNMYSES